jgi:hypothetical protein
MLADNIRNRDHVIDLGGVFETEHETQAQQRKYAN